MFGFNVTEKDFPYDNRPVSPLVDFTFEQWWFHGHLDHPPNDGDIFELEAGGVAKTEIVSYLGCFCVPHQVDCDILLRHAPSQRPRFSHLLKEETFAILTNRTMRAQDQGLKLFTQPVCCSVVTLVFKL